MVSNIVCTKGGDMLMKKIRLTAISIICIITFNVGLTGCANIKDNSDISDNHPSTISKTNGTSTPDPSPAPATVMPTQPCSSPSGDNIKAIDYNQYIKKVWIVKSWTEGAYDYSSFCIFKIANKKIEGKLSTTVIAIPDYYYYLPDHLGYLGNLTGTINNDTAECQFSDKNGNKGNVKLVFKENDEIEATIIFTYKSQIYKDLSLNGTFLFKPYNLKDIGGGRGSFSSFNDQCFTVDLNSWGKVNFVSGKIISERHIPTVAYLTNKDGDIFYDFTSFLPNNVNVKAVSFKDVNKDGLKDLIIILNVGDDSSWHLARVLFQNPVGSFHYDDKLSQEVNESGNNKDIKTIMDYLSKKL